MKRVFIPAAVLLAACLSSTAAPSPTPSPSPTFSKTKSPTITLTSTSTNTSTPTSTSTFTPTETPQPPETLTAIAKDETKTQAAANITATASKAQWIKTSTAESRFATATEIKKYIQVDWRELVNYPSNLIGEYIKIRGKVFNIAGEKQFQMWVGNYDGVFVMTKEKLSGLYEDMWVWVYGIGADEYCFTNTLGGHVCQPLIANAFWSVNPL